MRRVMSLYLPRWAMERRGSEIGSAHKPAVQAVSVGSRRLVSAVNPAAEEQGILPGLPLAEARTQLPGLAVAPADPEGDAAALLRLAQWCGRYSPWTVPQGPDGILLDITGCAHLVGGEDQLGAELRERLARRFITARIGIADTIGGASAMARGGDRPVIVVAPGATRQALAPLQDVVSCIREGCTLAEAGFRLTANAERHLKPPDEMARLFRGYESALDHTVEIARRCKFSLNQLKYDYPDETGDDGSTPRARLESLAWNGAAWRYPAGVLAGRWRLTPRHEPGERSRRRGSAKARRCARCGLSRHP
ncbi:MAG: hypothetical protein ACREFD_10780 [Stellaceae bacterium]